MNSIQLQSTATAILGVMLFALTSTVNAQGENSRELLTAVKIGEKSYVGVVQENEDSRSEVVLEDVTTGKVRTFRKAQLSGEARQVTDTEAIELTENPAAVIAWRFSKSIPKGSLHGKVAAATGGLIYTTLGKGEVAVGNELLVHRGETVIKDPDTGEVLGRQKRLVAKIEVTAIQGRLSKARVKGDLEVVIQVGDQVEYQQPSSAIAVLPPSDINGAEFEGTIHFADEVVNQLVRRKVKVVERAKLLDTLEEMALQSTFIFDEATTARVGKQLGATHVITGSVARARGTGLTAQFNIRLVNVATGQVENSSIFKTYPFRFVPAGEARSSSYSSGRRRKIDVFEGVKAVAPATEKGSWAIAQGGIMNTADLSIISLPVEASGSFQLELEINRLSGDNALMIFFPVGSSAASYHISHGGPFADGEYHCLDHIDGQSSSKNETRSNGRIPNGQWIKVSLDVSIRRDKATIEATLGGKQIIKWEGDVSRIAPSPGWHVANRKQFGLGVQRSRVAFRNLEITGTAKPVR
tara:strand:- start:113684 stop:115258 length:1575 start_codon:yes stop_codon:yes gene_type:complete